MPDAIPHPAEKEAEHAAERRLRVLIVEDSPTVIALISRILEADPAIEVVGTAANGREAVAVAARLRPDVLTMDVHMPEMDGFEATRRLMAEHPLPIVIVSGTLDNQVAATFKAVEAGALAFVPRPAGIGHPQHERDARELVRTIKALSEVKVVRRRAGATSHAVASPAPRPVALYAPVELVAIGASTGGPVVIQEILARLPRGFPVPVLVVQHLAPGFLPGFAEWLERSTELSVRVPEAGDRPLPAHVYLAPDGVHMGVGETGRIALDPAPVENGLRPAVSYLFRSVAHVYGHTAVGVLLTGMGRDGAVELGTMRARGAMTLAQNKESSVVHGMPGEAVRLGAATHVLAPVEIAETLAKAVRMRA